MRTKKNNDTELNKNRKVNLKKETNEIIDTTTDIVDVEYSDIMKKSYIDYAMSVITDRAVPDIRDGLKPVQRRILYDCHQLKLDYDKTYRKSARIVGDTMGKFHPHGDCLDGKTLIPLLSGKFKTIKELYEENKEQWIISVADDGSYHAALARDFRIGQYTDKVYVIMLKNGYSIKATSNHPFLLQNNQWVKVEELKAGMKLYITYIASLDNRYNQISHNMQGVSDKDIVTEIESITVERTDNYPMYDFTVDKYHNMLICANDDKDVFVVAHNSSIYESMVVMSQDFKKEIPLIDGHGNFGSIEGDSEAAARYTEARLKKITQDVFLKDLDKTIDFVPNYDNSETEPSVLPVRICNFLINGSEGIAVGMTTGTPTHNLGETIDAEIAYLKNPNISIDKLMELMPGPDFPTGGIVANSNDLRSIYETGTGKLRIRGKIDFEPGKNKENDKLVVSEIPYTMIGTGISKFITDVMDLVNNRITNDIVDIANETSKEGIRITLSLRKGIKPGEVENIKNLLYQKTKLEDTFGVNMLAIHNGKPEVMNLKTIFEAHTRFLYEITNRKYTTLLSKELDNKEIKEGLIKACDLIELIIAILRGSKDVKTVKNCLMGISTSGINFKTKTLENQAKKLNFTEKQATAILEMRLSRLVGLEINELKKEYNECLKRINKYERILGNQKEMQKDIINDLVLIKEEYSIPRKTVIRQESEALFVEKEAVPQDCYVLIDRFGYTKSVDVSTYEKNKENYSDAKRILKTSTTDTLLLFTNNGQLHQIKVKDIPFTNKAKDKGVPLDNLCNYKSSMESIVFLASAKEIHNKKLLFVTKFGYTKVVPVSEFEELTRKTVSSTKLSGQDEIMYMDLYSKSTFIHLVTSDQYSLYFAANEVSEMKKVSIGVAGIKLNSDAEVSKVEVVDKIPNNEKKAHRATRGNKICAEKRA